jgi:hypothetical protein
VSGFFFLSDRGLLQFIITKKILVNMLSRVARFFLVQNTKTGKQIKMTTTPNVHKIYPMAVKLYQMAIK